MSDQARMIHSAETAVDLAISIEQRGRDFYLKAKEQAKDPKLAGLLSFLAAEEERHLGLYRQILDHISGGAFQEVELVGGYGEFIKDLTDDMLRTLQLPENAASSVCLDMALRFEKDTLVLFHEIRMLLKGADQAVIEQIYAEEKQHVRKLIAYREEHKHSIEREKMGTYT